MIILFVSLSALLLLQVGISQALTYQEALDLGDPKLIQYDRTPFSVGFQAGVTCIVVLGMLLSTVTMFAIVVKQLIRLGMVNPRKTR